MPYEKKLTLWEKITLPFLMFYWRFFWKPKDEDDECKPPGKTDT